MKKIFSLAFLMFSVFCFGQDTKGTIKVKKVDTAKSEIVLVDPEIPPSFPGGEMAMKDFIYKNVKYPTIEAEAGVQGTVWVTFDVEEDGSITDVKILRGVSGGPGCDKEAIRVIKMMPKWTPAKMNEKPLKKTMKVPIKFGLK